MTSTEDEIRTAMSTYADALEPPPLADILARAEQPVRSRRSGRPVLAAALVVAVVASSAFVIDSLTNRPPLPAAPAATEPTDAAAHWGPFCGPGMPSLDWKLTGGKQPIIKPGRTVAIPMRLPSPQPDRRLSTFTASLVPADVHLSPGWPVPKSAVVRLTPNQKIVTLVFVIPEYVKPGKYNVIGTATFPSPSLCGHPNPPDSTETGSQQGGIGSVVIVR